MQELTLVAKAVKAEAVRLGFSLVGVTTPEPPHHWPIYADWIAAGRQAEMGYLATPAALARRRDPRLILPTCQAIVVVGWPYPAAPPLLAPPPTLDRPWGRSAAYAGGPDYHDLLPPKLDALADFLAAQLGRPVIQRRYTDTGPLLERELGQRAGLGWVGKNSMLISPTRGSYFLLGELLVDAPLPADPPFTADRCGSCTRCLDACPTGCIRPDRTLDAGRCLSYLTIEHKGEIPVELRLAVSPWVFGCDVCQQVCPWNRPRPVQPQAASEVWVDLVAASYELTPEGFRVRFRGQAQRRSKRRGYLRNVALALGAAARTHRGARQALRALAADPEPLVATHALWAADAAAKSDPSGML
jgi:epoxyqueuosine reductase